MCSGEEGESGRLAAASHPRCVFLRISLCQPAGDLGCHRDPVTLPRVGLSYSHPGIKATLSSTGTPCLLPQLPDDLVLCPQLSSYSPNLWSISLLLCWKEKALTFHSRWWPSATCRWEPSQAPTPCPALFCDCGGLPESGARVVLCFFSLPEQDPSWSWGSQPCVSLGKNNLSILF